MTPLLSGPSANGGTLAMWTTARSEEGAIEQDVVAFTVYGVAKGAGSKRAFVNPKTGQPIVTDDSGKAGKTWRQEVTTAGIRAMQEHGLEVFDGPLAVEFVFVRPRPASHYGSGKNANVVKPSAPAFPSTRPDVLKLARAVEDALTKVVWTDDARIVDERIRKVWGSPERCEVAVRRAA